MALSIDKLKGLKLMLLKSNIKAHLDDKYDWRVSRSVSTDVPLTEAEKAYRKSQIAEFDSRVSKLNSATTIEAVKKVDVKI